MHSTFPRIFPDMEKYIFKCCFIPVLMAIDSCLKCGKGPAQYGGLCANCRSNDISDTLEDSNKMPKFDIPQYIFFGPDLSAYVASLTKNRDNVSTPSARYNFDTKSSKWCEFPE